MVGDPGLLVIQDLGPRKGQGSVVTQAEDNVLVISRRKLNAQVNCDIRKYIFLNVYTPVNGGWGGWGTWSSCDSTKGKRERTRLCNFPLPQNGGLSCSGNSQNQESCEGIVLKQLTNTFIIQIFV